MKNERERMMQWYDDLVQEVYGPKRKDSCDLDKETDLFYEFQNDDEFYNYLEQNYGVKEEEPKYETPRDIYRYLDKHVWKQTNAKKAAAMLTYKCFYRNMKENLFFVGPSGCGKTYIWQCLQQIFPDRIRIVDGSNITQDGWKGDKTWASLLNFPVFCKGKRSILVIDEADKMLAPKFSSHGENVSHNVSAEGLKILEGTTVDIIREHATYKVNTEKISFVLCGAFSEKANDIAEHDRVSNIGFGAVSATEKEKAKAYDRALNMADLLEYGVMPEFLGRIQDIVNLEPMSVADYYNMMNSPNGPLKRIGSQYQAEIVISQAKCLELARKAYESGLGVRGMENQIRRMLDDELFEDWNKQSFHF